MYGVITINGKQYIERTQLFPQDVSITVNAQILLNQRMVLPGTAPFRLKTLNRVVIKDSAPVTTCPFKFKLGNSDGMTWYTSAGVGVTNDRVVDSCFFGTGQFPYVFTPAIYYESTSSILYEIEDISNNAPYTISIVFGGSYLIPVQ